MTSEKEKAAEMTEEFRRWRKKYSPYFNGASIRIEEVGIFAEVCDKSGYARAKKEEVDLRHLCHYCDFHPCNGQRDITLVCSDFVERGIIKRRDKHPQEKVKVHR